MPIRCLVILLVVAGTLVPGPAAASPAVLAPWVAPVAGAPDVTRPFELPPGRYAPGHRGVDLGSHPGTAVLSAGDGTVVFAGMVAGRPVVSIAHTHGLRTTYEPVVPAVGAGQQVARGSPIGTLLDAHAGCPRVACLHWGARRGEVYLDPLLLLRPPRVRLLPLG